MLNKILPYVILAGIIIIGINIFTSSPQLNLKPLKNKQDELSIKIDSLKSKVDSIQQVREIMHSQKTIIIKQESEAKNEVVETNNADSLIALFNKHYYSVSRSKGAGQ